MGLGLGFGLGITILGRTPPSAGKLMWLRADAGLTIATGVSVWADQSGNGLDVSQGTAGKQPALNATDAAYNNRPTLSFTRASSQSLSSGAWAPSKPLTFLIVGQADQSATMGLFDFLTGGHETAIYVTTTDINAYAGSVCGATGATTAPGVLAAQFNNSASDKLFKNNSQTPIATADTGAQTASGGIVIGALGSGPPSSFLNGKIAEILVYDHILSDTEMSQAVGYLGFKYGIPVS